MSYEITGKIYKIDATVQVNERFKKREFVLKTVNGEYSEHLKFQLVQDRCDVLNTFKKGDEVKVFFDPKGRIWTGNDMVEKCFVNLQAWKIEKLSTGQPPIATGNIKTATMPPPASGGDDDLPF